MPSVSPWASPITLVPKKDTDALRFCVNYRALNAVTKTDKWPMPRTDEVFDLLEGCRYFTKLDVAAMYWHIKMDPRDQHKTAFIVPSGLYEFTRMPFGLKNAPATAIRTINSILSGLNFIICFVYFDDIIVFARTKEEHKERLRQVLARLTQANFKLRKEKCSFEKQSIEYLGVRITGDGIRLTDTAVKAIHDLRQPTDVHGIRQFLGLCSTYRRFIDGFSRRAAPLNELLKKGKSFDWGPAQQRAFDDLKEAVSSTPTLATIDVDSYLELRTDASEAGLGACLL